MLLLHPGWLWLLLSLPGWLLLDWRGGGPRRFALLLLRGMCVSTVVLAVAMPLLRRPDSAAQTVVVVDVSPAVPDSALGRLPAASGAAGHLSVVAYASRAAVVADPTVFSNAAALAELRRRLARPLWPDDAPAGGANLAEALRLAGMCVPPGDRGQVRLFASGRNDHGDATAEAWRLAQRGIAITSEPIEVHGPGVQVRAVRVPSVAGVGQTVRSDVTVESAFRGRATVRLSTGFGETFTASADVSPGVNYLPVELPFDHAGLTLVRAVATLDDAAPATRPQPEPAPLLAAVQVNPPARVLLVREADADAGAMPAFARLLDKSAAMARCAPEQLARLLTERSSVAAVVLDDVPADRLPPAAQASLRQAVLDGTGLLVTGADRSFGPGGYADSSLAELLPVTMTQPMESVDPSTTLVLIIDTSASMTGARLDLAKEIARLAISHLKPHDKVGIVEFFAGRRWAASIQSAANRSVIDRALDRLTAGGGTTLYPAAEEAAFALRNVHTRTKHVLICSDGFLEDDAPFTKLVRRMADDGVTVSTVQVAQPDGSDNQMPAIARWGNGRYYIAADQYALPDLSLKVPQTTLTSPLVRAPSDLTAGNDPLLAGGGTFGHVDGYARTRARPTADVLLKTAAGDPLLARWRWGSGFVAVLPTQLGSAMTKQLQNEPAFARLLADLMRQLNSSHDTALHVTASPQPAGVEADVTAIAPASGTLRLSLTDVSGRVIRTTEAEAVETGHWNALFPRVPAGAYQVAAELPVEGAALVGVAGVAVPPPLPLVAADHRLLDKLSGFRSLADEKTATLPTGAARYVDARPACIVLAALLLLAHIAVRRWPTARPIAKPLSHGELS